LEKGLQMRKGLSEYIFFSDPSEKKIADKKCHEVEYPVSIDIKRTDGKSDHTSTIMDKYQSNNSQTTAKIKVLKPQTKYIA
jgi:hypothetical protein